MSIFKLSQMLGFNMAAGHASAHTAKKRLRLVLETSGDKRSHFVEQIRADILKVIAKYANISADDIAVNVDKHQEGKSVLELSVNFTDDSLEVADIAD